MDKFETKVNLVKIFETKLQDYSETKAELVDKVNHKLEEFDLGVRNQNSQLKDVIDECK